jgi:hypothetical protein
MRNMEERREHLIPGRGRPPGGGPWSVSASGVQRLMSGVAILPNSGCCLCTYSCAEQKVGQVRDPAVQVSHLATELLGRDVSERRIGATDDLAGQKGQVSPPAGIPRQLGGIDKAEHLADPIVAQKRLPVLVGLRPLLTAGLRWPGTQAGVLAGRYQWSWAKPYGDT